MVCKCYLNQQIFLPFYFFVYSLVLVSEKIYQTLETVFHPLRVVFSTLFSVFGNVKRHCLECLIYYFTYELRIINFDVRLSINYFYYLKYKTLDFNSSTGPFKRIEHVFSNIVGQMFYVYKHNDQTCSVVLDNSG